MDENLEEQVRKLDPLIGPQALVMAGMEAETVEAKNGLLTSKKEFIGRKTLEYAEMIRQADRGLKEKLERGYSLLLEKSEQFPVEIRMQWESDKEKALERIRLLVDEHVSIRDKMETFVSCDSFSEVLGFSSDLLEWFYQVGRAFFEEKKFSEASSVFCVLLHLDMQKPNYWIALALSEKALANYQGALFLFSSVSIFDPLNPSARYHSADLYSELGEFDDALLETEALSMIIETLEKDEARAELKRHHDTLRENILAKKQKA